MSAPSLDSAGRDLRTDLFQAAGDVSAAAGILSRATSQGRRRLRRRRIGWAAGGAAAATLTTIAVAGPWASDLIAQPLLPAGPATVRTVPHTAREPWVADRFVVDPLVQQAANLAVNAAVAASVPGLATTEVSPTDVPDIPLSTGQRGWTAWVADQTTTPGTGFFLSLDQEKEQPLPVVSPCKGLNFVTCSYEVLPDGTQVMSGSTRATFDGGGEVTLPFATATLPDGRVIRADATISEVPPDGSSFPADARITPAALREIATATSLSDLALPTGTLE